MGSLIFCNTGSFLGLFRPKTRNVFFPMVDSRHTACMKLRLLCFVWCALMLGQTPEARRHFKNAQGLFEVHDD